MKKSVKILFLVGLLFASFVFYCYYNYQFWTHFKTDNFNTLIEYRGKNIKGFRGRQILIHKDFEKHMVEIDHFAYKNDLTIIVNQAYRNERQVLGKTIVRPAKLSNHLAGFAIDFNIKSKGKTYRSTRLKKANFFRLPKNIQKFLNETRIHKNLRWGGDFLAEDPIHIDAPLNLTSINTWIMSKEMCDLDYSKRVPIWKVWK